MDTELESPALRSLRLIYENGQEATRHSWRHFNPAIRETLELAIRAGLRFDEDDFTVFHNQLAAGYWIGNNPDALYATACIRGNISACKAFEKYYGFKPYELDEQRIYVGRDFTWNGDSVTCTSIANDSLIACSYKAEAKGNGDYSQRISHRYVITHEQVASEEKKRKHAISDEKMHKARTEAEGFVKSYNLAREILGRPISELVAALDKYELERVNEIIIRRFKKSSNPTLLDFLVIGHRYKLDSYKVRSATLKMAKHGER